MISLRVMLVCATLCGLMPHCRVPLKARTQCPRCKDEGLLDFAELLRDWPRLHCLLTPGDVLRCEKCDGRLVRRAMPLPVADRESHDPAVIYFPARRAIPFVEGTARAETATS